MAEAQIIDTAEDWLEAAEDYERRGLPQCAAFAREMAAKLEDEPA